MTDSTDPDSSPLWEAKEFDESSVFSPEALLENGRRQKDLPERSVPEICILDPDGDIVR
jgi:uridine phosphorylase